MKKHLIALLITLLSTTLVFADPAENGLSLQQKTSFKKSVQLFGYHAFDLATLANNPRYAKKFAHLTAPLNGYEDTIKETLIAVATNQGDTQENALNRFGAYLLDLAHKFKLKRSIFMSFPQAFEVDLPLADRIIIIQDLSLALSQYLAGKLPQPSISQRITDTFFNNFWTTKALPTLATYAAFPYAADWAYKQAKEYDEAVQTDPSKKFGEYEKHCTIPTVYQAIRESDQSFKDFLDRYEEWVNNSESLLRQDRNSLLQDIKKYRNNLLRAGAAENNCETTRDIIQKREREINNNISEIRGQSYLHHENKSSSAYEQYLTFLQAQRNLNKAQDRLNTANRHSCDRDEKRDSYNVAIKRGIDEKNRLSLNEVTQFEFAINIGHALKDSIWALRPLWALIGTVKAAQWLHAQQIESYTKRQQKRLDEYGINKAYERIFPQWPLFIKWSGQFATQEQLDELGLSELIAKISDPLPADPHGVVLAGPDNKQIEHTIRGIAKELNTPYVKLGPLAATVKAKVQAVVKRGLEAAQSSPTKSAIIYLEDIDLIQAGTKAMDNIKNHVFNQAKSHNPYINLIVIASTTHPDKVPAELLEDGLLSESKMIA